MGNATNSDLVWEDEALDELGRLVPWGQIGNGLQEKSCLACVRERFEGTKDSGCLMFWSRTPLILLRRRPQMVCARSSCSRRSVCREPLSAVIMRCSCRSEERFGGSCQSSIVANHPAALLTMLTLALAMKVKKKDGSGKYKEREERQSERLGTVMVKKGPDTYRKQCTKY